MQTKQEELSKISWKNISSDISVTHFSSCTSEKSLSNAQVYVKKYDALKVDSKSKVTIFLLHDLGQHHGRFQRFIDWTREKNKGVSFIAMDFVGHGLSSGTRGHFKNFDYIVNDLLYLLNQTKKNYSENEKWIVLGHGMGGLVILDLLNRFQFAFENCVDGLILSNFILKISSPLLQIGEQIENNYLGFKKLVSHSRLHRLFRSEEILSSSEAILHYEQDPLIIGHPTLHAIREVQNKLASIYQDSYFLEKPIMILKSQTGKIAQSSAIDYFAKGIKKNLLTEKNYSHLKHDLYNEIENISVFEDVLEWMKMYEN